MKGTIALDIDGTITDETHLIPDRVAAEFEKLNQEGWTFIFVTGRPLSFTMRTLPKLCFPYYLGVQNGSVLFEMPMKKEVERVYLSAADLFELEKRHPRDFLVYSGYEKGDICYYIPERFSEKMLAYLKKVEKVSDAPWAPLQSFEEIEQGSFPLIKFLGSEEEMRALDRELHSLPNLTTTLIKDPLSEDLYLILITHKKADKGNATERLMQKFSLKGPLITGGNDNNDIPLLQYGEERIAIEGAPKELMKLATVVAPPSNKCGILEGLKKAMENLS